jgi:hypothetical protein
MLKKNLITPITLLFFLIVLLSYGYYDVWANIVNWKFSDSDDAMRVLEVRSWLGGQGFYDNFNHRANPPWGSEMHWSRLSDAPLTLIEIILRPFLPLALSEQIATFLLPPLLGALFLYVAAKVSNKLYWSQYSIVILMALFLSSNMLTFNFGVGRVDHHNLQSIALIIIMLGTFGNNFKGGLIAGFALAASLTIGFELLPIEVLIVAWLALRWLLDPNCAKLVKGFCIALFVGINAGLLINIAPSKILMQYNDSLSIAQALPIMIGSIGLFVTAHFFSNKSLFIRLISLAVIAVFVILTAWQFPILRQPLYWQISPLFVKLWFADVGETFPLKTFPLSLQFTALGFLLISIIITIWQSFQAFKAKDNFANWVLLSLILICLTAMTYFFQMRVMVHALAIAIIAYTPFISKILQQRGLVWALFIGIILGPSATPVHVWAVDNFAPKTPTKFKYGDSANCRAAPDFAHLAKLKKGLVATDISLGVETLLSTHHDVMATHFHRDTGRNELYRIFLAKPDDANSILRADKVDYIAYCNYHTEVSNIQKYYPKSFLAQISKGNIPAYLKPIPKPATSDIYVFEVIK